MSSPLVGTWSLNSFYRLDAAGRRFDYVELRGLLTYAPDGWMQVLICEQRPEFAGRALTTDEKAAIFDTMTAYAGTYTVAGSTVIHHVKISWNQTWGGADQIRHFELVGDILKIKTPEIGDVATGRPIGTYVLEWLRGASEE